MTESSEVSPSLKPGERVTALYAEAYRDGDSEWRRLGAVGKEENLARLCREIPHDCVLEIGAGEGSLHGALLCCRAVKPCAQEDSAGSCNLPAAL